MRAAYSFALFALINSAAIAADRDAIVNRLREEAREGYAVTYTLHSKSAKGSTRIVAGWQGDREVFTRQELDEDGKPNLRHPAVMVVNVPSQSLSMSAMPGNKKTGPIVGAAREKPRSTEALRPMFDILEDQPLWQRVASAKSIENVGGKVIVRGELNPEVRFTVALEDRGGSLVVVNQQITASDGGQLQRQLDTPGPVKAGSVYSQLARSSDREPWSESEYRVEVWERKPLPESATAVKMPAHSRLRDMEEGVDYRTQSDGSLQRTGTTPERQQWESWRIWGWVTLIGAFVLALSVYRLIIKK
ncbi:MAG: hypothetical protein ACOYON_08960 [Fimbriimonas sp.]